MNYERALATLNHARTGKRLPKKKLMNATWLHEVAELPTGQPFNPNIHEPVVDLVLFDKHILSWKPNGNIALHSRGYKTWSTKDRYARYLPSGFRVWQDRPFWYIDTPTGTRPFFDEMELRADGSVTGFPDALNAVNAHTLKNDVYQYSQFYAARLCNGVLSVVAENTCGECAWLELNGSDRAQLQLLEHVQKEITPPHLILAAVNRLDIQARAFQDRSSSGPASRQFLRQVIDASWHENQKAWRKPTSKRALIEQTELLMTRENLPRLDIRPRAYIKNLQMLVEDFLLEAFRFEWMED